MNHLAAQLSPECVLRSQLTMLRPLGLWPWPFPQPFSLFSRPWCFYLKRQENMVVKSRDALLLEGSWVNYLISGHGFLSRDHLIGLLCGSSDSASEGHGTGSDTKQTLAVLTNDTLNVPPICALLFLPLPLSSFRPPSFLTCTTYCSSPLADHPAFLVYYQSISCKIARIIFLKYKLDYISSPLKAIQWFLPWG